jgi:hypothetical protein
LAKARFRQPSRIIHYALIRLFYGRLSGCLSFGRGLTSAIAEDYGDCAIPVNEDEIYFGK